MSPEQARQVLPACRLPTDGNDPDVRAALVLVDRDPALADWWRQQQAVQAILRERFRELPVPPTLKERILTEHKVVRPAWWRSIGLRAAAIAAALVLLLALISRTSAPDTVSFELFRDRMVRTVVREYRMDLTTNSEAEIRSYLGSRRGHADFRVRPGLADLPYFGTGRLTIQGKPVSMVCFTRAENALLYLFVIDAAALANPPGTMPVFKEVIERATASWTEDDKVYVLASDAGMADLRTLLE